ncbi:hypothetical protein HU200_017829 [Digitaria exilis]|uniref:RRM domain-containing protein n=1 Tax=Digitaria exilis TaxID=1010633 RepID=A0A835KI11_9POAL|nr:hypothetical protein HU200_017829 [Digitaria exilis]
MDAYEATKNSGRGGAPSPLSVSSPSSWAQAPAFSRSNSSGNGAADDAPGSGEDQQQLPSPVNGGAAPFFPQGAGDALLDDLQLQEQLAFLNDNPAHQLQGFPGFDGGECWSPGAGDGRRDAPRLGGAAFPYSPTGSLPGSPSAASKCLSFLLQQQQQQQDRAAAAAALMLSGGDEAHKFMGRPRLDRADLASMMNPSSRQIYLTFPADSTFREDDVSNYFSIYGPVHDVRIPYQQKRMFGFVTFVYPETVKLILAKGNPHFICDARVLVKPYKEKGKVPDMKQQQGDFSGCTTPTGLDARDPFDLHQLGARMLQHSNSANELLLRRKLEEQQQAAELQQAIELQNRRLMSLQLLDLKASTGATATESPMPTPIANAFASSQPVSTTAVESPPESGEQLKLSSCAPEGKVNAVDKEESAGEASPNAAYSDQSGEHNLPDSPFASTAKSAAFGHDSFSATETDSAASRTVVDAGSITDGGGSHLRPPALDIPSPKPYFFPMHRCIKPLLSVVS